MLRGLNNNIFGLLEYYFSKKLFKTDDLELLRANKNFLWFSFLKMDDNKDISNDVFPLPASPINNIKLWLFSNLVNSYSFNFSCY